MGISTERNLIGDQTYEITTFGAKLGQKVLLRLFKVLGPMAAEIISKGAEGIGSGLALAATAATDQDLEFITDALAANTTVMLIATGQNGSGEVPVSLAKIYDGHFAGRLDAWALWLGWGIKVNFASFFEGKAIGKIAEQFKAKPSTSESQKV
jgi:hypothetical protein